MTLFTAITPAGAFTGGYIVQPDLTDMSIEPPQGTAVRVDASEVPPQILLTFFAMSAVPAVAFPLELVFSLHTFAALGYRKISRVGIFTNKIRKKIHSCIRGNPGISFNAIARMTGVRSSTLQYHLLILETREQISVLTGTGNPRYFENSGLYTDREKVLLSFLRNECNSRILDFLMMDPGATWTDIKDHLGKSKSLTSWYINRMRQAGIIRQKKTGKNVLYEIDPEMRQYLKKYLACPRDMHPADPGKALPEPA